MAAEEDGQDVPARIERVVDVRAGFGEQQPPDGALAALDVDRAQLGRRTEQLLGYGQLIEKQRARRRPVFAPPRLALLDVANPSGFSG